MKTKKTKRPTMAQAVAIALDPSVPIVDARAGLAPGGDLSVSPGMAKKARTTNAAAKPVRAKKPPRDEKPKQHRVSIVQQLGMPRLSQRTAKTCHDRAVWLKDQIDGDVWIKDPTLLRHAKDQLALYERLTREYATGARKVRDARAA